MPDSYALRFGPYLPPKVVRGAKLFCEVRGTVTVGGYSAAEIPWPYLRRGGGTPCLILCGDLVRAVKHEALIAVAHHWGVSETTVWKWRKALDVERWNAGSTTLLREWERSRTDDRLQRGRENSRKPASRTKRSVARAGRLVGDTVPLDGAAVERLRLATGLRRIELARQASLSNNELWRLETGRSIGLSYHRAERLAAALRVQLCEIQLAGG